MQLNESYKDIEKRGYKLAGISYDAPAVLKTFTQKRALAFKLLSDPQSKTIDLYGLRDLAYKPGTRPYGVAMPVLLILDTKGIIKAKLYEESYKDRPPVPLLLKTLDSIP